MVRKRNKPSYKVAEVHVRLDQKSNEALMMFCFRHRVTRTQAVTYALGLLAQEEERTKGDAAVPSPACEKGERK